MTISNKNMKYLSKTTLKNQIGVDYFPKKSFTSYKKYSLASE